MTIDNFETELLTILPVDDGGFFVDSIVMSLCDDGCLSIRFNDQPLRTEGQPWSQALDEALVAIKLLLKEKSHGR